ncbi:MULTISPECIES: hypothetical protein [unclassified Polaromonas]|uniref:hypothetical protein n=1 Tax=unclassified Polaromonas TaxID=2638319 RepID=UPI00129D5430|nr:MULTISPECIES: hypothetical protein [unclassified Polaromonas]QGJ19490.1 hypothetical protein F7R28_14560 [Polaromonas sp. Pch-P]
MTKLILVFCVVLAGAVIASLMGRKNRRQKINTGKSGAFGIAFLVTIGTTVASGFAIAGCASLRICTSGGDTDLSYVFYPLLAAPIHWLLAEG